MPENYVLLERTELNDTAASVTFANIPQTGYTDLKIVVSVRSDRASSTWDNIQFQLNGSTTSYSSRYLLGSGSAASSGTLSVLYGGDIPAINATASTFSNAEYYFPNYAGNTNKSVSFDTTAENNATAAYQFLTAGLWSNTAAITSITMFSGNSANFVANSTFSLYGIAAYGTTPSIAPKAMGGNRIDNDGTYWYHTFTSSGSFVPQSNLTADMLVIAGGGGGGGDVGGGAGAGRVYNLTSQALSNATSYVCTVGAGGATNNPAANAPGLKGTDSSFIGGVLSYVSLGGGGGNGRAAQTTAPNDGWNGGGGSYDSTRGPTAGNGGFAGGATSNPNTSNCQSGGGGGAAEAGNTDAIGEGGDGVNTFSSWATATSTGVSGFYAGGGGGGYYNDSTTIKAGGAGGGGNGGNSSAAATNATANTGSGGGGGGSSGSVPGGLGGSGIIIIRYPIAS